MLGHKSSLPRCIRTITDLGDHGVVVDADVTSLLDAAVDADLTGKGLNPVFRLSGSF